MSKIIGKTNFSRHLQAVRNRDCWVLNHWRRVFLKQLDGLTRLNLAPQLHILPQWLPAIATGYYRYSLLVFNNLLFRYHSRFGGHVPEDSSKKNLWGILNLFSYKKKSPAEIANSRQHTVICARNTTVLILFCETTHTPSMCLSSYINDVILVS